jgi:hypothetical protein
VIRVLVIRFLPVLFAMTLLVACDGGPERAGWFLAAEPQGATLEIMVERGACDSIDVNVTETNDSVTLSAYAHAGSRHSCPGSLVYEPRTIELRDPLGERELRGCRVVPDEQCATLGMR